MNKWNIGITCGSWDLLHVGHIRLLREAKSLCNYLIVGIHDDPSRERSWKNKPVERLKDRIEKINAIKYIDSYFVYKTEQELYEYLQERELTIDVRFLGSDYIDKSFTGDDLSIDIYYHKREKGISSSKLRERIIECQK